MTSRTSNRADRCKRFDLDVPAKWRVSGEPQWHSAVAKNASASGVLVLGVERAEVGAELEVWILTHEGRRVAADILCDSVVVRCDQDNARQLPFGIAMKLQRYKLQRAQA